MTTKRTNGPCHGTSGGCSPDSMGMMAHTASCPSLYPAQQEPDALTRLVRHIRNRLGANSVLWEEQALTLISEAREEQRRAVFLAVNNGFQGARRMMSEQSAIDDDGAKDPEP